jgi:hypothetical protein
MWVAADTAAATKAGDTIVRLPGIFQKIKIAQHAGRKTIVAVAGEALIENKNIFEYLAPEEELFSQDGLKRICTALTAAWRRDFEATGWISDAEKSDYLSDAIVSVLVMDSPVQFALLHGTIDTFHFKAYDPAPPIVAFGVHRDIQELLQEPPKRVADWAAYLAQMFVTASAGCQSVGFPVDVAKFNRMSGLTVTRCDSPDALRAVKS